MSDDFATLYISEDLEPNFRINRQDIIIEVSNYIKSLGISLKTNEFQDNTGRTHKESYFDSSVNKDIRWRIVLNVEKWIDKVKLFISFRPEFKDRGQLNYLNKENVMNFAKSDIDFIKTKIGATISISAIGKTIKFFAFSYGSENKIDISTWGVNFNQMLIYYENFPGNINVILENIEQNKPFSFRVIDLTRNQQNKNVVINSIISKLENYGKNLNQNLNIYNYTNSVQLSNREEDIVNIILIDKEDQQAYPDSKEFFLNQRLPFQHININGNLKDKKMALNMAVMEIYKKTHTHDLYLMPDHFIYEKIAGFIYIDSDAVSNNLNGKNHNLFTISYTMSQNVDYTEEIVVSVDNLDIRSEKDYLNIIDVDMASEYIRNNNKIFINDRKDPFYFNIIVTKELNLDNMNKLINALKNKGMIINRVYYLSNRKLRFADTFIYNNTRKFEIPYKIIGKNLAIIKVATKDLHFAQLFSTFVKILYPLDAEISEVDIKNIIWLSKKRLYRVYSVNNMTKIEPVAIKENNIKFLNSVKGSININYLI